CFGENLLGKGDPGEREDLGLIVLVAEASELDESEIRFEVRGKAFRLLVIVFAIFPDRLFFSRDVEFRKQLVPNGTMPPFRASVFHPEIFGIVKRHARNQAGQTIRNIKGAPALYTRLFHPALHGRADVAAHAQKSHLGMAFGDQTDVRQIVRRNITDQPHLGHPAEPIIGLGSIPARQVHRHHGAVAMVQYHLKFLDSVQDWTRSSEESGARRVHFMKTDTIALRTQQMCKRARSRAPRTKTDDDQPIRHTEPALATRSRRRKPSPSGGPLNCAAQWDVPSRSRSCILATDGAIRRSEVD